MKNKKLEEMLLKEYIRSIITEDASYGMVDPFAGGGVGGGSASHSAMYTAFVKPFVDVIMTGKGKLKELGTHVLANIKIAFTATATTFLPFLESDYNSIFKHQQQQLGKIRQEYGAVYKATWDAFKTTDIALMGFFCFPGYVMAGTLAKKSPEIALGIANTLTGGELDGVLDRMTGKLDQKFTSAINRAKRLTEARGLGLPLLTEKDKNRGKLKTKAKPSGKSRKKKEDVDEELSEEDKMFRALVTHPEFIKEVLSTPTAQALQKDARKVHEETMKELRDDSRKIAAIKNVNDLRKTLSELKEGSKSTEEQSALKSLEELSKLPPKDRQVAEGQLLSSFRASSKKMLIDKLKKKVSSAREAGYEGPIISDYNDLINEIQSL